ncbi:MAG TPA: transglycosylase domain-containing protein, partial [Candidatus Dojkabacteria bacterium]|nr:transglycosylase domain-containing protein [Candidatus Dojkabacteria bacterium]
MAYTTRIKLNKSRSRDKNFSFFGKRKYAGNGKQMPIKSLRKRIFAKLRSERARRILKLTGGLFLIFLFIGGLLTLSWVQSLTEKLPSPDKPFGQKDTASEIYDRNGKLLYRVFGDENRDPVYIEDVPELMRWAYLAAEDIDFYKHSGVDIPGVIRCAINKIIGKSECGASTITQQLITTTVINKTDRTINRKVSEIILSLQIESIRNKDEILEMYFNTVPEGSNLYGLKSAASFYFGKELKDLTLAEMAVLAAIPKDPSRLSPTKSVYSSPEEAQQKVKERSLYVLDQMENYLDHINNSAKELHGYNDPILTKEMIGEAREAALTYRAPRIDINAPHFVFYVQKLLQQRPYNNGESFTLTEVETGGYKIYTTIDLDFQDYAENRVKQGVEDPNGGRRFGAENAAMVALNPKNGQVLAWVGSKDYYGKAVPEGCTPGINCKFEPAVNIPDTLQSYGSSMKPMLYYYAMQRGVIAPGSLLADIPIQIGNYKPKNYSGGFTGIRPVRIQLTDSQNIPAILLANFVGVDNFIKEILEPWGYTTFNNAAGYGPSIAVGGGDIKLIE